MPYNPIIEEDLLFNKVIEEKLQIILFTSSGSDIQYLAVLEPYAIRHSEYVSEVLSYKRILIDQQPQVEAWKFHFIGTQPIEPCKYEILSDSFMARSDYKEMLNTWDETKFGWFTIE